ncbi:putative thiopurine S-methyltransferase [Halotydeus destructor]|nr:putative thiopurine S-methyltransferase [Halotydeus destructor]
MASGDDCLKFWHDKYWDKNFTPWQLTEPHKHLVANKDLLLGEGKVRVLVPLCGKTVDLKYLYDLGHEVVGVEGCAEAAKQFFKENGIDYVLGNDGITYQSLDKRLTIVNQNFFTVAGDYVHYFDCVWDRGGLWSVLPHHRGRFGTRLGAS